MSELDKTRWTMLLAIIVGLVIAGLYVLAQR